MLSPTFYQKLDQMTSSIGMNPEDLMAVMYYESAGLNPQAKNPGGAVGLLQFMPKTLEGLGFRGDPDSFRKLSGETQLNYVERYIKNQMHNIGGKFHSAAQYYVANFWPVALQLSGVKSENPNTVIVENNPPTLTDPQTGKTYSTKYFKYKITPGQEAAAYRENPSLDVDKDGKITYGDLMRVIANVKKSSGFQKIMHNFTIATNYVPHPTQELMPTTITKDTAVSKLDQLLGAFLSAVSTYNCNLIKRANTK